jgi:hypothetical protein
VGTIEAAWRSLMKRHHPDLGAASSTERSIRLNVAHDWLTDPVRRSRYDADRGAARLRREAASAASAAASPPAAPRRTGTTPIPRAVPRPGPETRSPAWPPGRRIPRMARPNRRGCDWRRASVVAVVAFVALALLVVGIVSMLVGGPGEGPSGLASAPLQTIGLTASAGAPVTPSTPATAPATASPTAAPTPIATVARPSPVPSATLAATPGPVFSGSGNRSGISMTLTAGDYAIAYEVSAPVASGCSWVLWLTDAQGFVSLAASAYPLAGATVRDTETETSVPAGTATVRIESGCLHWSFTLTRTGP